MAQYWKGRAERSLNPVYKSDSPENTKKTLTISRAGRDAIRARIRKNRAKRAARKSK